MIKKIFIILGLTCAFTLSLWASTSEKAAEAYDRGDYSSAISNYEQILKESGQSSAILYNLGNAYLKSGDYGKAMLNYQRALLLEPSDKSLKDNIAYLKGKVDDNNKAETKGKKINVQEEDQPFFAKLKNYIVFAFSVNTWAIWAGCSFIVTIVLLALYIFSPNVMIKKIGFFGSIVTLALSLLTLIFAFMSVAGRESVTRGVITGYKVKLAESPSENAKQSKYPLTRGTVMEVLETESPEGYADMESERPKWYKVQLNSDYTGWIKSEDFEVI